ncbi:MAG: PKD-like domain-containing protein [Bacteroidota bacterium]
MTFHIIANPTPVITATPSSQEICSGSSTSIALSSNVGSATFSWTVVQTGVSGASASGGTIINQTLTATGTSQGTAVYTITSLADGCTSTQTVTVKVNPIPTVTATPTGKTICSGSAPSIALTSNVPGATFNWTVLQTNVTGASNTGGSSINQVLTATTSAQGTAVYTVTPIFNSCSGTPITVTIKVNPTPVIADFSTSICSGNFVSYTPVDGSGNIVPTGTTYTWSAPVITGITGTISGTSQSSFSSGTLVNATANPIDVVYTIFPTAGSAVGGCTGNSFKVTVTVKPVASVSVTPASQEICSGGNFTIDAANAVPGTITSWLVASGAYPANITSSIGTSGSGKINNAMMSNSSTSTIPVTFNVSLQATSSGCVTTTSVTILVDAPLTAPAIGTGQVICGNGSKKPAALTSTAPTGGSGNYIYQWYKSTVSQFTGFSAIAGANGTTYQPLNSNTAWYELIVTDNCGPTPTSNVIEVTNNSSLSGSFPANSYPSSLCSGQSIDNLTVTSASLDGFFGNVNFTWQSENPGNFTSPDQPGGGPYGGRWNFFFFQGIADFTVHNITNAPITDAHLFITPNVYDYRGDFTCSISPTVITVTINPVPVIANSTTSTCSDVTFTYSPSDGSGNIVPTNTIYTWSAPTGTGFTGGIAGSGSSITGKLKNTTIAPVTARYTVTPKYTGSPTPNCPGSSFFLDVTINPTVTAGTISGPTSLCKDVTTGNTFTSNGTSGGTWSSSNTSVATVNSSTGVVTTINAGTTNITYTVNSGCGSPFSSFKTLTVNDDVSAGILSGSPTSICIGGTTTFLSNGTTGGTWSSLPTGIVSVNSSGVITGLAPGTATITYTVSGCNPSPASASLSVTVKPMAGQWTGIASTDWNDDNNWGCGGKPTAATDVVIPSVGITNFPVIATSPNALAKSITINSSASLTMSGAYNLTISNGGTFTNNGGGLDGSGSTGAVIFGGGTVNGTVSFKNVTINGAVDFGTASTVTGSLLINYNGSLTGTPGTHVITYGSSSSLIYNTGTPTTVGNEWTKYSSPDVAGFGLPNNVTIQDNTIVNIADAVPSGWSSDRSIAGSLTINSGSTLNLSALHDLHIAGNWTNNGAFTANGKTVTFDGASSTQLLTGNTTFYNLTLNNTGATTDFGTTATTIANNFSAQNGTMNHTPSSNFTMIFTGVNGSITGASSKYFGQLQINSGASISNLSGGDLHISYGFSNNGGNFTQDNLITTYFDNKNTSPEALNSSGTYATQFGNIGIGYTGTGLPVTTLNATGDFSITGGSMMFYKNSIYNGNNNTVTFSTTSPSKIDGTGTANFSRAITNVSLDVAAVSTVSSTIKDTLRINTGGNIINNHSPLYANTATLVYQTTDASRNPGPEWLNGATAGLGVPQNVSLTNTNSVVLAADRTVPGTLTLSNGSLAINGNTLTLNGAIFTTGGTMSGSRTSHLVTGGSGAVKFTQTEFNNYLKELTINSGTLSIGLTPVTDTLNITASDGVSANTFGTVTVKSGGVLNSNSNLNLKSDTLGTAIVGPSYGNINDEVTVERYFPAIRAWRFVGVPFSSSTQTINQAWQEGNVSTTTGCPENNTGTPGYGTAITYNNDVASGFDIHNNNYKPSIEVYQNNNWVIPTSTINAATSNLVGASSNGAYSLFVRGDRNVCLFYEAPATVTTLRPKGGLNQINSGGPLTLTFNSNSGNTNNTDFVMIGNPYAAPVDIKNIMSAASSGIFTNRFYVWNPRLGAPVGTGGYETVSLPSGIAVPNDGSNDASYTAGSVIQSGQAFMVQMNNTTNGALTFNEVDKSNFETNTGVFGLQGASKDGPPSILYMNLLDQGSNLMDGVGEVYGKTYTSSIDSVDVPKRWNTEIENIALIRHDTALAIEFRPVPVLSDTIFIRLYLRQHPYILQLFPQNFTIPLRAWIIDKYLNTKTEVHLTDTSLYNFTPNADTNSYRNRFMIVFNQQFVANPVPVTKVINQNDPNITGISNSIGVDEAGTISIQPNPVTSSKQAVLRFNNIARGGYEITLYNTKGQKLASEKIQHNGNRMTYGLPNVPSLTAGMYTVIVLNSATHKVTSLNLIIIK